MAVLALGVLLQGCDSVFPREKPEIEIPTTDSGCREFAMRRSKDADHGNFLLDQCLAIVKARSIEDVGLSVFLGGIEGGARFDKATGLFTAHVYNNTGYDLTEFVLHISIFKSEKDKKAFEEKPLEADAVPIEHRSLRFRQNHPNQSVLSYSSELDEPIEHWVWNGVGGKGIRVQGVASAAERFREDRNKTIGAAAEITPDPSPRKLPTRSP